MCRFWQAATNGSYSTHYAHVPTPICLYSTFRQSVPVEAKLSRSSAIKTAGAMVLTTSFLNDGVTCNGLPIVLRSRLIGGPMHVDGEYQWHVFLKYSLCPHARPLVRVLIDRKSAVR
jgi:hypothetical protein